jgi:hypothetical protein
MSGIVALIDRLNEWTQENVCNTIELKERSEIADAAYAFKLVHPTAFPVYCSPDDKGRTVAPRVPSVTVQMDKLVTKRGDGTANIAMIFVVWNPGEHDFSDPENKKFTKNTNGWRDLFGFMDHAISTIEKSLDAGGYVLDGEITARPLNGDQSLMGTYPYYYGELSFTVKNQNDTTPDAVKKLL